MKLGILLAGKRAEDIATRLVTVREAGFSLCQLNLHQTGFTRGDLMAVADVMLEHGVRPLAIGCYVNPLRPDDVSLSGVTRADLDMLLHALEVVGARRIVLWSGTHSASIYDEHPDNRTSESLDSLREFITDVVRETRARNFYLVLEPWRTHVLYDESRAHKLHSSLAPDVAERVRYVLDAANLMTPERYVSRDDEARHICQEIGPLTGVAHLKDVVMPPDGDECLEGPGRGKLDYAAYIRAIFQNAAPDAAAIIKNTPPSEYAEVRDYLLRLSDRWRLA